MDVAASDRIFTFGKSFIDVNYEIRLGYYSDSYRSHFFDRTNQNSLVSADFFIEEVSIE